MEGRRRKGSKRKRRMYTVQYKEKGTYCWEERLKKKIKEKKIQKNPIPREAAMAKYIEYVKQLFAKHGKKA